MATDVDVQYFSHLNGLTLGNNWGDLIRLLDKALVTGIDFTQITAASIDAQGDVHITLYAAHNAMLLQVVELLGFSPASLNQKYRIKGVPSATELILKPHISITETSITTVGSGKLAPLGYEIIFRDTNDVKRVYRAKNPTAQHPFIRVDESLTSPDGTTGVYTSSYAKYAMVGLLEHMEHIDDFENPDVLQLPFDPTNPAKNWKITGLGTSVVRGWSKWIYATSADAANTQTQFSGTPSNANRAYTLVGDKDAFYILNSRTPAAQYKLLAGCGIYDAVTSNQKNWFLITVLNQNAANSFFNTINATGNGTPAYSELASSFYVPSITNLAAHAVATPIVPDYNTGLSNIYQNTSIGALEIPFRDNEKNLRGTMKNILYSGNARAITATTPIIGDKSMYLTDCVTVSTGTTIGGLYFYLGELE